MQKIFTGQREVYLEIADRYERFIRLGILRNGDKLPSVRVAAGEMGVNPNTVQRAFRHLESLGLIETLPKKGVYVTYTSAPDGAGPLPEWVETIVALKKSGVTYEELINVIKEVYSHD